jgi:hypothetical protein
MKEGRLNLSCEEMIVYELGRMLILSSVRLVADVILGVVPSGFFWVERRREPESFRKGELWAEIGVAYLKILCVCVGEGGKTRLK